MNRAKAGDIVGKLALVLFGLCLIWTGALLLGISVGMFWRGLRWVNGW